jgi:hypothetical protein
MTGEKNDDKKIDASKHWFTEDVKNSAVAHFAVSLFEFSKFSM